MAMAMTNRSSRGWRSWPASRNARAGTWGAPLLAAAIALAAGCGGGDGGGTGEGSTAEGPVAADARAVREVFARFRDAMLEGRGRESAALVDPRALETYERCRAIALASTRREGLEELPLLDLVLVISLRVELSKREMEEMATAEPGFAPGAAVFAWAVERGLIDKPTLTGLELDRVTIKGDRAIGSSRRVDEGAGAGSGSDGEAPPGDPSRGPTFEFTRVAGEWRFDMTRLLEAGETVLRELWIRAGRPPRVDFVLKFLAREDLGPIPDAIANGPLR